MTILNVRELSKAFGSQVLFENIGFAIDDGEKIGLIGRNGAGKSTLFRILAGDEPADDGVIALRRGATIGYLSQEPAFSPEDTPRSVVAAVMQPARDALEAFEAIAGRIGEAGAGERDALLKEQARLQTEIERHGGWTWQHRVEEVLDRLGIAPEDLDRPLETLSGGQRRRTGLAAQLLARPDLMILDEPTNHLDTPAIEWLEETLLGWNGALLLVTHDRYFLERVVTRILEFDPEGIYSSPGNYSVYLERKLERQRVREQTEHKRARLAASELEWLRTGPKARSTKQRARVERAEALQDPLYDTDKPELKMELEVGHRLGGTVLELEGVTKSYDGRRVLDGVDLAVRKGERIAVIGPNGCGKSTLLEILVGHLEPDGGKVTWGKNTRIAYLSQYRGGLDDEKTVLEALGEADHIEVGGRSVYKRTFLREFLFDYDDQQKKVASLSGGERCRLLLAKIVVEKSNFIILDEPTNDLDIESMQVLEEALVSFGGCVLFVTHDRYFTNRVCTAILAFEPEGVSRYDGDYELYRKQRAEKERDERRQATADAVAAAKSAPAAAAAKPRKLSFKERQEFEAIEATILEAEEEKERLESRLADPALYRDASADVASLTDALHAAERRIEQLYARWQELELRA